MTRRTAFKFAAIVTLGLMTSALVVVCPLAALAGFMATLLYAASPD